MNTTTRRLLAALLAATIAAATRVVTPYVIDNWWPDGDNIVMDDVFLPAATWSAPAQNQLAEWNEVDTTLNNHPFLINLSPQFSFGANDGDNTMGFLGEAGLNSEYGLSYASALAWTVCWSSVFTGRLDECDMMLNPALPWSLSPDPSNFFQSTVLHEAGHIRGLDHYNSYLSMQNSGVDKLLRHETLYMDDRVGVRQHASFVPESDMVAYSKWHNGSVPQWMTTSPTTVRVGQVINWNNLTVENRGTTAFGSLSIGFYMSSNTLISTGDTFLNSGSWGSFGTFTFSTFNWSAVVPSLTDCGTRYFGAIVDNTGTYPERYESNNNTTFVNGSVTPAAISVLLERDALEPNDSFVAPRIVSLPLTSPSLTIDQDMESDYYRFTVPFASRVDVTVNFTHAFGDVDLDLRNSGNGLVGSSTGTGNSESVSVHVAAGTYYIRVYGFGGGSCNRYSISATATPAPVSITATDPGAAEVGGNTGTFTVTRAGDTSTSLTVFYTVGGTATPDADYTGLPGSVTMPAGSSSAPIVVTPVLDGLAEGTESVIVTLSPGTGYTPEAPTSATVTIVDGPDFYVPSFTAPAVSGRGVTFSVNDTTANSGSPSPVSTTGVYLSTNSAVDGSDTLLGTRSVPALATGATHTGATTVTIPLAAADGTYYVIVKADQPGGIAEPVENNNTKFKKIKIGPDLLVSAISASASSVPAGGALTVKETTKNAATASPVAVSTITRVYLSVDKVPGAGDVILSERTVGPLATGGSSAGSHPVVIPAGTAAGAYYLIAVADATGLVAETRETNNKKPKPLTITP
ncbi:MAG: pre-peptidase C-terminal domain-containing protein [Acidobacteria bacterium]|nr:pre-peptidase C-terminal domain-containing protein [Acidobacteriota bacterium]